MRAIILNCTSPYDANLSKVQAGATWKAFLAGGTSHSANASTLPYVIRRCEREGIPFELTAHPGHGYFIKPLKSILDVDHPER